MEKIIIFQIWFQTSVGPAFSTREKAVAYISKIKEISIEEVEIHLAKGRYPDIREIILDRENIMWDR